MDVPEPDGFGSLVRRRRVAIGLTQEQLAEQTGISVRAISDIERGQTARPRRSSVELIARVLRLTGADAGQHADKAGRTGSDAVPRVTPHQVPDAVRHFIGRSAELARLTELLDELAGQVDGMHDLLRAYARELAEGLDGTDDRRAALTRLYDYYLQVAAAAMDTLFPSERHRRPRIPPPRGSTGLDVTPSVTPHH